MAAATTEAKTDKKNGAIPPEGEVNTSAQVEKDDFVEIVLDRPSLNFENFLQRDGKNEIYKGDPVEGLLLASLKLGIRENDDGTVKELTAYILKLSKPAKAFTQESVDTPVDCKAGDEVLMWPNAKLDQAIALATGMKAADAANHPTHAMHIRVQPLSRVPFKAKNGDAQRMWNFRVSAKPTPVLRDKKSVIGVMRAVTPARQITAGESLVG